MSLQSRKSLSFTAPVRYLIIISEINLISWHRKHIDSSQNQADQTERKIFPICFDNEIFSFQAFQIIILKTLQVLK